MAWRLNPTLEVGMQRLASELVERVDLEVEGLISRTPPAVGRDGDPVHFTAGARDLNWARV
jgi:hypothetical protein